MVVKESMQALQESIDEDTTASATTATAFQTPCQMSKLLCVQARLGHFKLVPWLKK